MIERRAKPRCRGVAGIARCRIAGCDVVRHRPPERRGALIIGSVATVTICWQRAAIVAVHVAQRASHRGMRPSQWESRRGVIES